MSWNKHIISVCADTLATEIDKDQYMPQEIKDAVKGCLKTVADKKSYGPHVRAIQIITSGHVDNISGGSILIDIKNIDVIEPMGPKA